MAGLFDTPGFRCEECGENEGESTRGYKVVEQRHLCPTCSQRLADAILSDVSKMAIKWPCKQHEQKEVELFCRKCQDAICTTCGFTAHSGHEMEDIWTYFAAKKQSIEKDVEELSEHKARAMTFLEMTKKCTENVDKHFEKLRKKLGSAFEAKSKDIDSRSREEIEKIQRDAEEDMRRIVEKRDSAIQEINERIDNEKSNLGKNNFVVSAELKEIHDIVTEKSKGVRETAESVLADIDVAEKVARSMIVDCDSKVFEQKIAKLHEMHLEKLPTLPEKELLDSISATALKLRFKRVEHTDRVGYITGKQTSYEMVKTLPIPKSVNDPFLIAAIDEGRLAVRDGCGSTLLAISLKSGEVETLLESDPKRGLWDVAFLGEERLAYSDFKCGKICVCDMNGELEHTLVLPGDGSRFAYLSVDNNKKLIAATHADGLVYVIDSVTGQTLRQIDIECDKILEFDTFQNGNFVVRYTHTDILVLHRSSGATMTKISFANWSNRINCHVGADGMIYVIYCTCSDNTGYTGNVGVISPDEVMRRQNFITFPTSFKHRYRPRCVVSSPGTVVILNGSVLLVYKEMAGVDNLV